MIIVDRLLRQREAEGKPVRVGMIGAGFMARGVANQIVNSVPGMKLVAVANRTMNRAVQAYTEAGVEEIAFVGSQKALDNCIATGRPAVTQDPMLLCAADGIDCLIDATGAVEHGAQVTMQAIAYGKHVVTMNAELDGTVGPILKRHADKAGVILTGCDGDQPGVQMNLYRFVRSIGLTPLLCGNIKGLQDPYRNPTTQKGFAERWGQNAAMVTSFADGSKISFEQAIVANATGMSIAKRGMLGLDHTGHVDELTKVYDVDMLRDYLVRVEPLNRALADRDAWITGQRREQATTRGALAERERALPGAGIGSDREARMARAAPPLRHDAPQPRGPERRGRGLEKARDQHQRHDKGRSQGFGHAQQRQKRRQKP